MNQIRSNLSYFYQLLRRLGIILLAFTIIKIIFYSFNADLFPLVSSRQLAGILLNAIRFDWVSIIYINSLFILLSLVPVPQRRSPVYKKIQLFIFLLFNGLAILFELIDVGFYKFAFRRTIGSDLSLFMNTSEMVPGFIAEYWFLPLIFVLIMFSIYHFYTKTDSIVKIKNHTKRAQIGIFFLGLILFAIGARGGLQLRPVMPITAIQYIKDSRLVPLINNTSLSLIFSTQQQFLEKKNYFPEAEQETIFNSTRQYHSGTDMDRKNVFILVLESFGQEHVSYFNPKLQTTPFLDSLIGKSFFLEQSYANGLRSTQGIVAVTAGIPSLMPSPLMFSAYQSNRVDGLANLLGSRDYITSFFHGANPGSMEFERFSKLAGFQNYYDRRHFNNDKEYDGQWGIWDEPFFQYTAQTINQYNQPFCALTFSLTSHHPYKTPEWFEEKYPEMKPLQRSIRYTDYALKKFFATAEKMPWYKNTIFLITADHSGKSDNKIYQTRNGRYKIPILLFDPSQVLKGGRPGIAQQIDIMPTVLDLLKYDEPFLAYGESMLDSMRSNHSFNFNSDLYQIVDKDYLLLFDEEKTIGLYRPDEDPFLKNNQIKTGSVNYKNLEDKLKAIIQQYHKEMIGNRLYRN
ncbi:MAG: phosphoglycerol transferase MdoB-like AlkP superfamily enzyme [Saprospiraceae bacterium]|jgi:phosphoglycerol transferase MdoB-like AlkP superfamily enzyme